MGKDAIDLLKKEFLCYNINQEIINTYLEMILQNVVDESDKLKKELKRIKCNLDYLDTLMNELDEIDKSLIRETLINGKDYKSLLKQYNLGSKSSMSRRVNEILDELTRLI